jgi:site-specific DNA recombinase
VELFDRVQNAFSNSGKPGKYRKHSFAFSGLMKCHFDGCTVTAGLQKSKYIYYRCTGHRGKCDLPYMREEYVSEKLGELLKNVYVPEEVAQQIVESLKKSQSTFYEKYESQRQQLQNRIAVTRKRMDQAYTDKLDGNISEEFWQQKSSEWSREQADIQIELLKLEQPKCDFVPSIEKIFELAQRAHSLYLTRKTEEQARLLKKVVLNCETDGVSLYPTYRKPFDLIFKRAKNEEWSGRADLNCRPLAPQASALPG